MKKRTVVLGALVSMLPIGQPLLIGTGAVMTSAALMLSVPGKVQAESSEFYFDRALDKAKRGDYYGAIADFSKVIEIQPRNSDAYYNLGLAKSYLEDYDGAIVDYTKAIEINPRYAAAYSNRGNIKARDLKDYYDCYTPLHILD